jgi:diguanylate cyclase (GGDEF)-like protein
MLWGMGTAAINRNDDAALTEATLRLDGLADAAHDPVAAAVAGFLRARHDIANGSGDGLGEALRAAARMQGHHDPALAAWAHFQLCDAYTLDEKPDKALPLCYQAVAEYRALGDAYGQGDAENDVGLALATQGRVDDAAAAYQRSRQHFRDVGADELVVMVGDNLAQMYLKQGRAHDALALSQASLQQELAAGRVSDALGSMTDIAQAEAALGRHRKAYADMRKAVAQARAAGIQGQLIDMLRIESRIAEGAGDLRRALADEREATVLQGEYETPALRAVEAELAQRYAVREKELRIGELERANRMQELQLRAASADVARRHEHEQRQRMVSVTIATVAIGLLAVVAMLVLLLRAKGRYALELQEQALRDPLTGIGNRRAFMQQASQLLAADASEAAGHVLMLIDFDHFKRVNDSAGHPVGDRVLAMVAECLERGARGAGHAARVGGEEFAVLCPHLGAEAGVRLAETLRSAVAALPMPAAVATRSMTISVGVAVFDGRCCRDLSGWMRAADSALYSAKSYGRNRVVAATVVAAS